MEQVQQQTLEDLQGMEDKANHLGKLKVKLESQIEDTEDQLEQERKVRSELEKAKRKLEADLRAATDNVSDLARDKAQLEENIRKYVSHQKTKLILITYFKTTCFLVEIQERL